MTRPDDTTPEQQAREQAERIHAAGNMHHSWRPEHFRLIDRLWRMVALAEISEAEALYALTRSTPTTTLKRLRARGLDIDSPRYARTTPATVAAA